MVCQGQEMPEPLNFPPDELNFPQKIVDAILKIVRF